MPERPRVLQMGPDPGIGGGMAAALRGLLESPLTDRYELEVLATYRDPRPLPRLLTFLVALCRLALWSLRGRGRVVHVHGTVRGSSYRKAVCVLWARALRRRVVYQVHSGAAEIASFHGRRDPFSHRLLRLAFHCADVVLAVSEASAEALRSAYGLDRVVVVPNPAPSVALVARPSAEDGELRVAYLGGFANPAKGGDLIVAALELALEESSDLRATLAGPGDPPPAALELAGAHPRVEWAGWLEPEQKDALLRGADTFVLSSRSEGLPMALLEAMAYGMAIVATAVGGVPEVVEDGVDGLLVPAEDPAALARALLRLRADGDLRHRLGAAARARAERLDDVEVAGRLDGIYAELL